MFLHHLLSIVSGYSTINPQHLWGTARSQDPPVRWNRPCIYPAHMIARISDPLEIVFNTLCNVNAL